MKRLSRGGSCSRCVSRRRRRSNGCRRVCLYLYYARTFTSYPFPRNTRIISSRCRASSVCKHVYVNSCVRILLFQGDGVRSRCFAVRAIVRGEFEGDFLWERNEKKILACVCVCVSQRRGQSEESASTMNWWKVRAVVNSPETSPGCEGMLVSGAEARGTSHL